jgi:hypothetical protein
MSFSPTNALPQIPAIQRAVDPDTGTITAEWLRWLNLVKQRTDYLSVEGIIDARTIIEGTITVETLPALSTMAGQIIYGQMPVGSGIWAATPTILGDLTISANLLPLNNDSSDLGSATKQFRRGYVSEINAVLFSKQTQQLYGGWLSVSKNAGTFKQAVLSTDTAIDFGQAMTLNQFVLVRAVDASGAITEEYIKVGALIDFTYYNVTRNLSGAGAKNWPANTPYQVRGVSGDGWIELNAFDTPRMSVFSQGSAYNNSSELIRIGHLTGMPNSSSGIGAYMGDATNYFRWDGSALTLVSAGCTIDASGITLGTPTAFTSTSAMKFNRVTTGGFGQAGDVNSLHAEAQIGSPYTTFISLENTIKGLGGGSGGAGGDSRVSLIATGWNNAGAGSSRTAASLYVESGVTGSVCSITAANTGVSGNLTVTGTLTGAGGKITAAQFGLTGRNAPAQITTNQNNYAINGSGRAFIFSDAARDITGIVAGYDGEWLWIVNYGSFAITLKYNSGSSSAANRIVAANGADVVIRANNASVLLQYDSGSALWYVLGA